MYLFLQVCVFKAKNVFPYIMKLDVDAGLHPPGLEALCDGGELAGHN